VSDPAVDYKSYLQSPEWERRRQAAFDYADHRCQVCYSNIKIQAHHRTYERLGAERPSDLTVLCDDCHAKYHGKMSRRLRLQRQREMSGRDRLAAARSDKERAFVLLEALRRAP